MKVSVALCTYNGEKFIQEQLESLFNQIRLPDEIVISDDGSSDQTIHIISKLTKSSPTQIRILPKHENLGVFKNFPYAISECEGDIIFTCDQDDVWETNKIEKHMDIFENNPDLNLVYSNAEVVGENLDRFSFPLWSKKEIRKQRNGYSSQKNLVYMGRSIAGCCMSFKKSFFQQISPFPNDLYHDDWIATCASIDGRLYGIEEPLMKYRQHGQNVVGIIRGRKWSYYKSLFTNVRFYVKSDQYLYTRHQKMVPALLNCDFLKPSIDQSKLMTNLEFYKVRSNYLEHSLIENLRLLSSLYMKRSYNLLTGLRTYFKDIYNVLFIEWVYKRKL